MMTLICGYVGGGARCEGIRVDRRDEEADFPLRNSGFAKSRPVIRYYRCAISPPSARALAVTGGQFSRLYRQEIGMGLAPKKRNIHLTSLIVLLK